MANGQLERELSSFADTPNGYPYAEPGSSDTPDADFPMPDWQALATDWVRDNQTLAMVLGFATGVFLGVMMRD